MKKKRGGLIAGFIAVAACIAGLFLTGSISSSFLRTLVNIVLIAGLSLGGIMALIVAFARKSSNDQPASTHTAKTRKSSLTAEQAQSLDQAHAQLVNARMTIARIHNSDLNRSGVEACNAMDKVLKTLREKPEKIQTSRQLFNYYIPTMEKVVNRYQRIEDSKVDMGDMPGKLQNYFSDVKDAMGNLYEGLFDNDKLNAEVDMEAMTIAIKRDGLLDEEDFDVSAKAAKQQSPAAHAQTQPAPSAQSASTMQPAQTQPSPAAQGYQAASAGQAAQAFQAAPDAQAAQAVQGTPLETP